MGWPINEHFLSAPRVHCALPYTIRYSCAPHDEEFHFLLFTRTRIAFEIKAARKMLSIWDLLDRMFTCSLTQWSNAKVLLRIHIRVCQNEEWMIFMKIESVKRYVFCRIQFGQFYTFGMHFIQMSCLMCDGRFFPFILKYLSRMILSQFKNILLPKNCSSWCEVTDVESEKRTTNR